MNRAIRLTRALRRADNVLPIYLHAHVPVALATDDEGIVRSELTLSFKRAVEGYGLTYPALKQMVRASLEHAFVPGASLWPAPDSFGSVVAVCRDRAAREAVAGGACRRYLHRNEKAALEWREEAAFARFEAGF